MVAPYGRQARTVLNKRDSVRPGAEPPGHPEAIVRPDMAAPRFTVERLAPRGGLAEFVDYLWLGRGDAAAPHRQQVVPQPRVHLAAERGRLLVHGVTRKPFFRTLEGSGHVLGAAFHPGGFPGGFRPLLGGSVGAISGTVRPLGELVGADDAPGAARILGGPDPTQMGEAPG